MNIWQKILQTITFGLYNPGKKFEQEVLGEATTNLEEIENSKAEVEKAVSEYDKYFPNKENYYNGYAKYDSKNIDTDSIIDTGEIVNGYDKNRTVHNLIKNEEKLQEQGKYVGMDELTRINAVLAEGRATRYKSNLELSLRKDGLAVDEDVMEAERISKYQYYMDNPDKYRVESEYDIETGKYDEEQDLSFKSVVGRTLYSFSSRKEFASVFMMGKDKLDSEASKINDNISNPYEIDYTDEYVAVIIANDRATRQNDGTHETKTSAEWKKIDKNKEKELRNMSSEELESQYNTVYQQLIDRKRELMEDKTKEGNER